MEGAIFLDRDGVINEVLTKRVKFVNQSRDFHLLPGVGEAIHLFNKAGFPVFMVTNQGGVGLGYMKEQALLDIHEKMQRDLAISNASLTDIAYCPHKPHEGCLCRKPKAEMLLQLAKKHNVDLKQSFMVGDRGPDIEAGKKAQTKTVLVGSREKVAADYDFPHLLAFAKWLTGA